MTKSTKYKIIRRLATSLNCEDFINWDEYSDVVPRKAVKTKIASELKLPDLNINVDLYKRFTERYINLNHPRQLYMGDWHKEREKLFRHYEEPKKP